MKRPPMRRRRAVHFISTVEVVASYPLRDVCVSQTNV